jgi:hypothetical protein
LEKRDGDTRPIELVAQDRREQQKIAIEVDPKPPAKTIARLRSVALPKPPTKTDRQAALMFRLKRPGVARRDSPEQNEENRRMDPNPRNMRIGAQRSPSRDWRRRFRKRDGSRLTEMLQAQRVLHGATRQPVRDRLQEQERRSRRRLVRLEYGWTGIGH